MRYLIYIFVLSLSLNSFATTNADIEPSTNSMSLSELTADDIEDMLDSYPSLGNEFTTSTDLIKSCEAYLKLERVPLEWNSDKMRTDRWEYYQYLIDRCVSQLSK